MLKKSIHLIPVSKWNNYHEFPTVGAIRQLIFYNTQNFVEKVIRKISGRMYIDEYAFAEWIEETNSMGGN